MNQLLKFQEIQFAVANNRRLQRELSTLKSAEGQRVVYATARSSIPVGPFHISTLKQIHVAVLDEEKFWLQLEINSVASLFYYFVSWNSKAQGWDYSETYFFEQVPEACIFIRNILRVGKQKWATVSDVVVLTEN